MFNKVPQRLTHSLSRYILRARRPVTILFTDIEDSTAYWDRHGDVRGRLMVDRHNRLIFPVIRQFRGRVVKTIGDAIMAVFKKPEHGVRAAVAIQQMLERVRRDDPEFDLRVRIGLHTGEAIVEDRDVFGDAVNVASRVESHGKGNEILLSSATANGLPRGKFPLKRAGSFTPRGKRKRLGLLRCVWEDAHDLTTVIRLDALPLVPRQKLEVAFYALASLVGVGVLYYLYGRYLLADQERVAMMILNPDALLHDWTGQAAAGGLLVALGLLLWRLRRLPTRLMSLFKGGFGFTAVFVVAYLAASVSPWEPPRYWNEVLHESHHLFVEVRQSRATVHEDPSLAAPVVREVRRGTLLLLTDIAGAESITWNRVPTGTDGHGWIPRVVPARIGVPETRVTITRKHYIRYRDVWLLGLGLLGLLWGTLNFRIKPS